MRIFSSAPYCLRVLRLMSLMMCSDDEGRPAGLCFISTPQFRINKNTLLNQNYICPIGADVIQVYRLLKAHDLITSPAFIVMKAAKEFKDKTTAVNQMWQTDFTYFRIINWGWYYLSTVLDDFSRYIIAWKLSPTMGATDVTETLDEALAITGVDQIQVEHRPRLLSDNGSAYGSGELREYRDERKMRPTRGAPYHP